MRVILARSMQWISTLRLLCPSRLPRPSTSTLSLMPLPVKWGRSATIGHSRPALSKPPRSPLHLHVLRIYLRHLRLRDRPISLEQPRQVLPTMLTSRYVAVGHAIRHHLSLLVVLCSGALALVTGVSLRVYSALQPPPASHS